MTFNLCSYGDDPERSRFVQEVISRQRAEASAAGDALVVAAQELLAEGPAVTIVTDAGGRDTVFADAPTPGRIQIVRDETSVLRCVSCSETADPVGRRLVGKCAVSKEGKVAIVDSAAIRAAALNRCRAEEEAVTIRCYSGPNVPEQLMTPAFAELMWEFRRSYVPALTAVGAELLPRRRAAVERLAPRRAFMMMGEEAVRRLEVGHVDPVAATEQLTALRDHAAEPHLSVLIHPLSAPALPLPTGRFVITTDLDGRHTVFEEAPLESGGLRIIRSPHRVQLYLEIFAVLCANSLGKSGSLARIDEALRRRRRTVAAVADTADSGE
ncbi:Scr1 family TA system antitoxin-like transcriptional regulator [Amycolatopsis thailandensis]|uniref:Scr1 family TA system antitoxin-like transcriptional regulator n=1 Tax=Amycolatopsis thailandensis TaxID=589330 RepID=UPI0036258D4D